MSEGGDSAALLDTLAAALPPERAEALRAAYALVRSTMPAGYEESVSGRMICWSVPLALYPKTYNKQPLMFVALATTKGHNALHFPLLYMSPAHDAAFRAAYAQAGQKLDMGKGCVRFVSAEGLNEAAITNAIRPVGVEDFLAAYERARSGSSSQA
ncbi:DUF1801 domain-containing protein [Sphingomonas astaxanthinifaciens]|uniref:YdhG-like domain-containing protein n=1 Tax=Sphingomonas astaxanthinifaciens DSM 22298 TaxID=1123267 RepID=A0ABQ5Z3G4_9SPHN|nr:DUF1801 domain-containing protein [Sphingomonas astaxanthinifaciens]GLR47335.1 hypothetical protein GCM10007925_10460 [Sphingomonas astaxanthinifaciens DSM 22298]